MLLEEFNIIEDFTISKGMAGAFTDGAFGRRQKFPRIGLDGMDCCCVALGNMPDIRIGRRWNIKR